MVSARVGCFVTLGLIVTVVVLIVLASFESDEITGTPPWRSVQHCVGDHIRYANGHYPLPGDDVADLRRFCERALTRRGICNFDCLVTSVGWEFAITGPQSTRAARIRDYFSR